MAERGNRKSKRSQNNSKTPETMNISKGEIEDMLLKALYTMNANKYPNVKIQLDFENSIRS